MARRRLEAALQVGKNIDAQVEKSEDSKKRLIETKEIELAQLNDGVLSLQYSYSGESLAVGYGDGGVDILNPSSGRHLLNLKKHKYGSLGVTSVKFNPRNKSELYVTTLEGEIFHYDITDGKSSEPIREEGNEINCLDFNITGDKFATGGKDLDIRLYDVDTQKVVKSYEGYNYVKDTQVVGNEKLIGHYHRVFALKFHPEDANVFITGGWDNNLKVWDARTKVGVSRTIPGPHVCGDSLDILDNFVLAGSWVALNPLQLFDFREGEMIKEVPFFYTKPDGRSASISSVKSERRESGAFVYCAQFCSSDIVLAGGSGTNSVQAINWKTDMLQGEVKMKKPVQALDNIHDGKHIAVGAGSVHMKLCSFS